MTNYNRGTYAEREARKMLQEAGWLVMRSAGSKGPFDLAVFGGFGARLIQVKTKKASEAERVGLMKIAAHMPASIQVELWERTGPRAFTITRMVAKKVSLDDETKPAFSP